MGLCKTAWYMCGLELVKSKITPPSTLPQRQFGGGQAISKENFQARIHTQSSSSLAYVCLFQRNVKISQKVLG